MQIEGDLLHSPQPQRRVLTLWSLTGVCLTDFQRQWCHIHQLPQVPRQFSLVSPFILSSPISCFLSPRSELPGSVLRSQSFCTGTKHACTQVTGPWGGGAFQSFPCSLFCSASALGIHAKMTANYLHSTVYQKHGFTSERVPGFISFRRIRDVPQKMQTSDPILQKLSQPTDMVKNIQQKCWCPARRHTPSSCHITKLWQDWVICIISYELSSQVHTLPLLQSLIHVLILDTQTITAETTDKFCYGILISRQYQTGKKFPAPCTAQGSSRGGSCCSIH